MTGSEGLREWLSRGEVELYVQSGLLGVPAISAFVNSINVSFRKRNNPLADVLETVQVKPDGPLALRLADGETVHVDQPAKRQICPAFSMPRLSHERAMFPHMYAIRNKITAAAARHEFAVVYGALQNAPHDSREAAAGKGASGDVPVKESLQPWTVEKFSRAAKSLSDTEGPLVILASTDTVHGLWANNHPRSDQFRFLVSEIMDRGLNSVRDKASNLWVLVGQLPNAFGGSSQGIEIREHNGHLDYEEFVFDPDSIVASTSSFGRKLTISIDADAAESYIHFKAEMTVGATVIDPSGVHRVINQIPNT